MIPLTEIDELEIEKEELKGFSRTLVEIEWLLIVLVILYMEIPGSLVKDKLTIIFALISFAVFILFFHYCGLHRIYNRWKLAIETWAMIAFITLILWHTGKIESPLLSLYFLVIITTATTLGNNITLLEVGLISVCCLFLSFSFSTIATLPLSQISQSLIQLFPFWLVAYLASMLSRDTESAKKKIKILSQTDDLTGLLNMRTFSFLAERERRRSIRYGHPYCILMLDADNLKTVNDTFGHEAGGKLIKHMGKILQNNLRSTDIIARYGGDEFVVLLPEAEIPRALVAGERARSAIENTPLEISGEDVFITVSIGVASYPEHGMEIRDIMNKADKALYKSKEEGKNRSTCFSPPL
jgi:diguanylate cyclase (GGDEF)-like protein